MRIYLAHGNQSIERLIAGFVATDNLEAEVPIGFRSSFLECRAEFVEPPS